MNLKSFLFFQVLFFTAFLTFSQEQSNGSINGVVIDQETGDALIGANIYLQDDLTYGTTSDLDGKYSLELEPGEYIILFSYTGMKVESKKVVIISGKALEVNISMMAFSHDFDEITITAGKYERRPEQLMVSTEMINRAVIESKNTVTIETVLDQIPGVNILDSEPQIRGGSGFTFGVGSKVAVILDDMPMINASAGKPDWGLVPVENIKQVEVVKGPGSVLTGASAMSGAIFFRSEYVGDNPRTKVRLYGGLYLSPKDETQKWWTGANYISGLSFLTAQHLDSAKSLEFVASGMANFEKGPQGAPYPGSYAIGDSTITDDDIKDQTLRLNINVKKNSIKHRGLSYGANGSIMVEKSPMILAWFDDTAGFYRGYPGAVLLQEKATYYLDPFVNINAPGGNRHQLMFRIMGEQNDLSNGQYTHTNSMYGKYEFSKHFHNLKDLKLVTGMSGQGTYANANIYEASGSPKNNVISVSAYAEIEKRFAESITLLIGFRGEYYAMNKEDEYIIPLLRASLNFKIMQETYLRMSFGQGTRFPTIAERYIRTDLGAFGVFDNPELVPESGWNAEIGLKQGFKFSKFYGYLDVSTFLQEYNNTVEYLFGFWGDPINHPDFAIAGFKFINTGRSRVSGIDVSLTGQAKWGKGHSINVIGGYTFILPVTLDPDYVFATDYIDKQYSYNTTSVEPENKILKYRFQHTFKIDISYSYKKFSIGMSCRYYSRMANIDQSIFDFEDHTSSIGGNFPPLLYRNYFETQNNGNTVFDGRIGFQINENHKLSLISNNFLNRTYSLRPLKAEAMQSITLQYLGSF